MAGVFVVAVFAVGHAIGAPAPKGLAADAAVPTSSQAPPNSPLQPADALVRFEQDRLTIQARAVPLVKILEKVTRETGVSFFINGSLETAVTADFTTRDLEQGLKRLTRGLNTVFFYGPGESEDSDIRLTAVLIVSSTGGQAASVIRPTDDDYRQPDAEAIPYHKLFEDIDRLEEAADTDESAIIELARLAQFDENKLRRVAAMEALGESDAPQYANLLYNIARNDADPGIRASAVEALGNVSSGSEAATYLLEALNDHHPEVRAAAVEALADIGGTDATDALMRAVKDEGSLVRVIAVEALGDLGDQRATPVLIEALDDADEEVREFAKDALEEMGIPQPPQKR